MTPPRAMRNDSMTRAVVFAYHNVGVRCLKVLLAHGVDVGLVVTIVGWGFFCKGKWPKVDDPDELPDLRG